MSTRAVYTFKDSNFGELRQHHVYKHHDGYPEGAISFIKEAIKLAWPFPRFEASEFAAAFIAANKTKGGGSVYCTHSYVDHYDLDYRYEIEYQHELIVTVFECKYATNIALQYLELFKGDLNSFTKWIKRGEK
jgi:hypothetical protein